MELIAARNPPHRNGCFPASVLKSCPKSPKQQSDRSSRVPLPNPNQHPRCPSLSPHHPCAAAPCWPPARSPCPPSPPPFRWGPGTRTPGLDPETDRNRSKNGLSPQRIQNGSPNGPPNGPPNESPRRSPGGTHVSLQRDACQKGSPNGSKTD